jgi:hypothetical protein
VYLADREGGLRIYAQANPTALVAAWTAPNPATFPGLGARESWDVALYPASGRNYVLLADGMAGVWAIDVTAPAAPVETARLDTPGSARGATTYAGHLYVADLDGGLRIASLAGLPGGLTEVSRVDGRIWQAEDVALRVPVSSGDAVYALVAGGMDGLLGVDVTDPAAPVLDETFETFDSDGYASALALRFAGTKWLAYVADAEGGLIQVDVTNPRHVVSADAYPLLADPQKAALAGDYAFVASGATGLRVVSAANPAALAQADSAVADTPGFAWDVVVIGSYAFLADDQSGVYRVDVASPTAPQALGSFYVENAARQAVAVYGLEASGNRLYAATSGGIFVLQTDGKGGLAKVGGNEHVALDDLALSGGYAYGAAGGDGLIVYSLANPNSPALVGSATVGSGYAWGLALGGGRAYVAAIEGGLRVFDVADPSRPREIGAWTTPTAQVWGAAIAPAGERFVHVADGTFGVRTLSVAGSSNPTLVAQAPLPGMAVGVTCLGPLLYASAEGGGLYSLAWNGFPYRLLLPVIRRP